MTVGYSITDIGTKLSWEQLKVFLQLHNGKYQLAKTQNIFGAGTDIYSILLGNIFDTLNIANWQRTGKKSGKPKSIFKQSKTFSNNNNAGKSHYGKKPLKPKEMFNFLRKHGEKNIELDHLGNVRIMPVNN
jgi:hypothetical protein